MLSSADFWQFACQCYQESQSDYLQAQDELGLNVNMLLLCQYLNRENILLSPQQWLSLHAQNLPLCDDIDHHRAKRREAKKTSLAEYKTLLAAELELEKLHQRQLIQGINQFASITEGKGNIKTYVGTCHPSVEPLLSFKIRQWK